jgi:LysM repeat protein
MLALLLGQSSMVRANSGESDDSDNPMSVSTERESKVNLEEKKDEETKVEEKKDEKEEAKEEQKEEKTYTTYTVVAGDSLSLIAKKYLGNANKWRELVSLNKDKYPSLEKNPDLIIIGWELKVPVEKKEEPADNSDTKVTPENKEEGKEVTVTDNSTKSEDVDNSDIPNWTTEEKIKKLQDCVDATNRAMVSIGFKVTDLTTASIKYMIDNGFMKQEDWMAMNPPIGYTYRINLQGKVELVDCNNIALTSDQITKLDKELAEKKTTTSTSTTTTKTNTNSKVDPTAKEVEDWLKGKTKSNTSTTTTDTGKNTVTKGDTDPNTKTNRNTTTTKSDTKTNTNTTTTKSDTKTNTCTKTKTDDTKTKSDNRTKSDNTKTKSSTCTGKTKTKTSSSTDISKEAEDLGNSLGDLLKALTELGEATKELGKSLEDASKDLKKDVKDIKKEFKKVGKDIKKDAKEIGKEFENTGRNIRDAFVDDDEDDDDNYRRSSRSRSRQRNYCPNRKR